MAVCRPRRWTCRRWEPGSAWSDISARAVIFSWNPWREKGWSPPDDDGGCYVLTVSGGWDWLTREAMWDLPETTWVEVALHDEGNLPPAGEVRAEENAEGRPEARPEVQAEVRPERRRPRSQSRRREFDSVDAPGKDPVTGKDTSTVKYARLGDTMDQVASSGNRKPCSSRAGRDGRPGGQGGGRGVGVSRTLSLRLAATFTIGVRANEVRE